MFIFDEGECNVFDERKCFVLYSLCHSSFPFDLDSHHEGAYTNDRRNKPCNRPDFPENGDDIAAIILLYCRTFYNSRSAFEKSRTMVSVSDG